MTTSQRKRGMRTNHPERPDNPGTLADRLITNIESPPSTTKTKGTGEESST